MFLNIKYKDPLNLNTFVIKYTKCGENSIDEGCRYIFQCQKKCKIEIISGLFNNNYLVL